MRHSVFGSKLSRNTDERKRLLTGLVRDVFTRDGIITSVAKAKAVQPIVEKLITKAKKGEETDRRHVTAAVGDKKLADRIMEEAKTRFASRTSGFTRIIKMGKRMGDATDTAQLSFVDVRVVTEVIAPKKEKAVVKKQEKKPEKTVQSKKTAKK